MGILHRLMIVMFGLVLLVSGTFIYWNLEGVLFHRPLNHAMLMFQTEQEVYAPGDIVTAKFTTCKNTLAVPIVQWSLVDTFLRIYPQRVAATGKVGCYDNVATEIEKISPSLPDGEYHFSGTLTYQVNPLKTIVVVMKTNTFKVKSGIKQGN